MIKLEPYSTCAGDVVEYKVFLENNDCCLGNFYKEIDGFFVYETVSRYDNAGFWESHVLRAIADKLDELNKPWMEQINNDPRISDLA